MSQVEHNYFIARTSLSHLMFVFFFLIFVCSFGLFFHFVWCVCGGGRLLGKDGVYFADITERGDVLNK